MTPSGIEPPRHRVLACVDNRVGFEILRHLVGLPGVAVVGAIVHPRATALYHDEIAALCEGRGIPRFDFNEARGRFEEKIAPLAPDFLVSLYFDYVLDPRFLDLPTRDAVNLHPGYLPFNRGFYYYVWAVLDGTPAGVSLHRMRPEVDRGDLIGQARVAIDPADTGEIIYRKHEDASIELFASTWPAVADGRHRLFPQLHGGTRHGIKETRALAEIDPFESFRAIDLIDRVRLLTDADGSRCTVRLDGKTYRLSLRLEELADPGPALASLAGGCREYAARRD